MLKMVLKWVGFGLIIFVKVCYSMDCFTNLEWSTKDGQIIVNGQALVLKGIRYPGFQTRKFAPLGLTNQNMDDILDVLKNNNFNAIQIFFSMELISNNPKANSIDCVRNFGFCGATGTRILDLFIYRAAARGLLVVLSNDKFTAENGINSPPLWYDSQYSEELVIRIWNALVARYRNQWNVFAIDLKNEPRDAATWGNSRESTDWNKAAERMIKRLSGFKGLFFVEGVNYGTSFEDAGEYPIKTGHVSIDSRVIYTPNCYGPVVMAWKEHNAPDFPKNLDAIYQRRFGFLTKKGFPFLIGGWGSSNEVGSPGEKWTNWFVNWTRTNCLTNNFYWSVDPYSSFTAGLFESDWVTLNQRKLDVINRIQPNPTKFESHNGKICITKGKFPEKECQH